MKEMLRTYPSHGLLPIYLGDDQTDEDAFRVLEGNGISVFIGPGELPSEADFFLKNPDEVQEFLFRCLQVREKATLVCRNKVLLVFWLAHRFHAAKEVPITVLGVITLYGEKFALPSSISGKNKIKPER